LNPYFIIATNYTKVNTLRAKLARRVFTRQNLALVLLIAAVPVLIFWARNLLDAATPLHPWPYWLGSVAYSLLFTASLFYGCFSLTVGLNHHLPWEGQAWKRLAVELLVILGYAVGVQLVIIFSSLQLGLYEAPFGESLHPRSIFDQVLFGVSITLIVVAVFEGISFFKKWRKSLVQAERLRAEHLQSQYALLRAQLDPHFMFNSLNVLSSLIRKDAARAETYLDHFAQVYRQVLENQEEKLIPLAEEMRFVDSYLALQRIRFGELLQWQNHLPSPCPEGLIPPLSLQELLNNAIKHNKMSAHQPLYLELWIADGWLYLRNNYQPRPPLGEATDSTGTGWRNLKARYQLLKAPEPHYGQQEGCFTAALPLIKNPA
jgi:hypothetical protein